MSLDYTNSGLFKQQHINVTAHHFLEFEKGDFVFMESWRHFQHEYAYFIYIIFYFILSDRHKD